MKLVFVSNYFNHHQKALCERLYARLGEDFVFLATKAMKEERRKLGYEIGELPKYVVCAYDLEKEGDRCTKLIDAADAVIIGSAPEFLVKNRKNAGKLILRYSERPFKNGFSYLAYLPRFFKWHLESPYNKPIYMLCASAYTASDYSRFLMYRGRTFKWGYFPEVKKCNIDNVISSKEENSILWCGRFIDWKHPDDAIEAIKRLVQKGYSPKVKFIGTGEMEDSLKAKVDEFGISNHVEFLGSMSPEKVREHMEKANKYLITSDFKEGWGAVVNEAMASGCALVASHGAGAVPFLIKNEENGLVYESGNLDDLTTRIESLLKNPSYSERLGKNGYETISRLWNAEVAADRLLELINGILTGISVDFKTGPCSFSQPIKNDWIRKINGRK